MTKLTVPFHNFATHALKPYICPCPQILARFSTISLHRLFANSPILATLISCVFKHVCSQPRPDRNPARLSKYSRFFFQDVFFQQWNEMDDTWKKQKLKKKFLEDAQANSLFERPRSKWNYNVKIMIFFFIRPSISYAHLVRHKFYNCSRDCTIACKSITEPVSEVNGNQTNILGFSWFWNSLRI
jgi:hypothetical protein